MNGPNREVKVLNYEAIELALELAETLGDEASLRFYNKLAVAWSCREWGTAMSQQMARKLLVSKARELAGLRAPKGPLQNPAAVFVAWVKKLDASPKWNPNGTGATFASPRPADSRA